MRAASARWAAAGLNGVVGERVALHSTQALRYSVTVVAVASAIEKVLLEAPVMGNPPGRVPKSFTHRELAQLAYGVEEPSSAQLASVRRAVGRLVAGGRAERVGRAMGEGVHVRRDKHGRSWFAHNPGGIEVRRVRTELEQAEWDAGAEERMAPRAEVNRTFRALSGR